MLSYLSSETNRYRPSRTIASGVATAVLLASPVVQADFTWTGDGSNALFTTDNNWLDGQAPQFDLSGDALIFGATGGDDQRPDVEQGDYTNISGLSFTGADAQYVIEGLAAASLRFESNSEITNDSTLDQRIQVDVFGAGNSLTLNAQDGALIMDGDIFLVDTAGTALEIIGDNEVRILERILGFTGSLDMRGTNTLKLERNSSYSGGTRIFSGRVLLGAATPFGTSDIKIKGDAVLQTDDTDRTINNPLKIDENVELKIEGTSDLTFGGVIRGKGSIRIDMTNNNDAVEFNRTNTFKGGVVLERGVIQITNADGLGKSDALVLEGKGGLRARFPIVSLPFEIQLNDNTLSLLGQENMTFAEKIFGSGGGILIDGEADSTGVLPIFTFDQTMEYTDDTSIISGELRLLGSVDSNVNLKDAGRLSGTGKIFGDLTNGGGGVVRPGDIFDPTSLESLRATGDYEQRSGASIDINLNSDELVANRLKVDGQAILDAKSDIITTVVGDGYIPSNTRFEVIKAVNGVFDDGADINFDDDTITIQVVRDQNFQSGDQDLKLKVERASNAYSAPTNTENNFAIGTGLDSMISRANGDPTGEAAKLLGSLDRTSKADYNAAVNSLSAEPYHATTTMNIDNARTFTTQQASYFTSRRLGTSAWQGFNPLQVGHETLEEVSPWVLAATAAQQDEQDDASEAAVMAEPWDPKWSTFARFDGVFTTVDSAEDRTGYDSQTFGGQLGIDRQLGENFIVGMALGYMYTNTDWNLNLGRVRDNTIRVGPYASYVADKWFIDASVTFAYHFYTSKRNIALTSETAEADFGGWEITAYGGGGYDFDLGRNFVLTPMASIQYGHFAYDSFSESGGGGADISVDGYNINSLQSRLSLMLSYYADLGPKIQPYAYAGWEHEYLNQDAPLAASFVLGATPFSIQTAELSKDRFFWGIGVSSLFTYNVSAFVNFEQEIATDFNSSFISGGLSLVF
jgi:uncharacterized protein with beta-barrel porin domain